MKNFKEYIIESGNLPYSFKTHEPDYGHTLYSFNDHNGTLKAARFTHQPEDSDADFFFHDHDRTHIFGKEKFAKTNLLGYHSIRLFSTLKSIIRHHVKNNPALHSLSFSSYNEEPSRVKLYSALTKKLGGESETGLKKTFHQIPLDQFKD